MSRTRDVIEAAREVIHDTVILFTDALYREAQGLDPSYISDLTASRDALQGLLDGWMDDEMPWHWGAEQMRERAAVLAAECDGKLDVRPTTTPSNLWEDPDKIKFLAPNVYHIGTPTVPIPT